LHRQINSAAPIRRSTRGNVEISSLLNLNAYAAGANTFKLDAQAPPVGSHLHNTSSVIVPIPVLSKEGEARFDEVFRDLLWHVWPADAPELQILRAKGLYKTTDGLSYGTCPRAVQTQLISGAVVQGVREIYETKPVQDADADSTKLVLIGRHLPADLADQFLARLHSA
jgi:G3E family GTPase